MTADEFVEALQKHAPDFGKMVQAGSSEEYAIEISEGYIAPLRNELKSEEDFEILNLLFNYQAEQLSLGVVSFFDQPETYVELGERYIGVGKWYGEFIVLDTETGKILLYDIDAEEFTPCADSSEKFFDALAHIFIAIDWYNVNEESGDQEFKHREESSRMAGSIEYIDVWENI